MKVPRNFDESAETDTVADFREGINSAVHG